MKKCAAFVVPLLVVIMASGAIGSVTWQVDTTGVGTTYTYTYVNTEEPYDFVTGLHMYAPVDASLIIDWDADAGWSFDIGLDLTGAADIYWYTDDMLTYGIDDGSTLTVSMTAASSTTVLYDYVLEDFPVGNWGYDTTGGMTWVMNGSMPVPSGSASPETPEPASLLALLSGCAAIIARRKK